MPPTLQIRLDETIDKLALEVERDGISQPCTITLASSPYALYNAMGDRVGTISVALRLTSMGGNMLAHVPCLNEVVHRQEVVDGANATLSCKQDDKVDDPSAKVIGDYKTISQQDVDKRDDKSITLDEDKVTRLQCYNASTQISSRLRNRKGNKLQSDDQVDKGLVSHPDPPPALLYNNENDYSSAGDLSINSECSPLDDSELQLYHEKKRDNCDGVVPILMALLKEFKCLRTSGIIGTKQEVANAVVHIGSPVSVKNETLTKDQLVVKSLSDKLRKKEQPMPTSLSVPSHTVAPIKRRPPPLLHIHPRREIKLKNPSESNLDFLRRISQPKHRVLPFVRDADDPIVPNTLLPQGHVICGETKSQKLRIQALNEKVKREQRALREMYPNVKKKEIESYLGLTKPKPNEGIGNLTKKERKPRIPSCRVQRKPVPTPRHSIGNLTEKIIGNDKLITETNQCIGDEIVEEKLSNFEKDKFHFKSASETNMKKGGEERLDEAIILKVIREVMVERAMRTHKYDQVSVKQSEDSENSYTESYSDDLEQVSDNLQESSKSIGNLSDLEVYHQSFTGSSDALSISEPEVFILLTFSFLFLAVFILL